MDTSITMVDLRAQYLRYKSEIDTAIASVLQSTDFIEGEAVRLFSHNLSQYLGVKHVITCANGTDALMLALLSLKLQPADEIIVPSFTFAAPAETSAFLGLTPVFADVYPDTFCIDPQSIIRNITSRTKAIIPVHLFGQCANMDAIMDIAAQHNLFVIEDTAQAFGASFNGKKAGTIGHIGCTSFFPSKNLGCYGDGGAVFTNDDTLAESIRLFAHHGSRTKYLHETVGINSRLDTLQAAILNVKLPYLDEWNNTRRIIASKYNEALSSFLKCPVTGAHSTHIFHQYTVPLQNGEVRGVLQERLKNNGIASTIYYPFPLNEQQTYKNISKCADGCPVTKDICSCVLSLPIYPELSDEKIDRIIKVIA
ncbi:MAG: DegT/DnrJ/EryC1/StrS family aminotransferase [Bacteroidales bacterium]|jgi:dTDP-4-amino-4,6-dideoxygalactose transaminase|nr:DegT/DnrJ/EryC1/StrS family aminotransferase [Bacteroidales bacterium]